MRLAIALLCASAAGCTGVIDGDSAALADAGAIDPDPLGGVGVSGTTLDYFGRTTVPSVDVVTAGLGVEQSAVSTENGTFVIDGVPPEGAFFFLADAWPQFVPTINDRIVVSDTSLSTDVFVVSRSDVQRQYATAGMTASADASLVSARLATPAGEPLLGLPRDALSLVADGGDSVGVALFVGALGDVSPSMTTSDRGPRGSEVMILDVPSGAYTLSIDCPGCVPAVSGSARVFVGPGGVTLVTALLDGAPATPTARFEQEIYKLLQRGSDGGAGCALCHTAAGPGAVLPLDDSPADVYSRLIADPELVDPDDPDGSLLLERPVYEVPADHPNATWISSDDPGYQLVRQWIASGAPF